MGNNPSHHPGQQHQHHHHHHRQQQQQPRERDRARWEEAERARAQQARLAAQLRHQRAQEEQQRLRVLEREREAELERERQLAATYSPRETLKGLYPSCKWLPSRIRALVESEQLAPLYAGLAEDPSEHLLEQHAAIGVTATTSGGPASERSSASSSDPRSTDASSVDSPQKEDRSSPGSPKLLPKPAGRNNNSAEQNREKTASGRPRAKTDFPSSTSASAAVATDDLSSIVVAEECLICFLFYEHGLNRTICCNKGLCTECFLQIKPPDDRVECPFCAHENLQAVYSGVPDSSTLLAQKAESRRIEQRAKIASSSLSISPSFSLLAASSPSGNAAGVGGAPRDSLSPASARDRTMSCPPSNNGGPNVRSHSSPGTASSSSSVSPAAAAASAAASPQSAAMPQQPIFAIDLEEAQIAEAIRRSLIDQEQQKREAEARDTAVTASSSSSTTATIGAGSGAAAAATAGSDGGGSMEQSASSSASPSLSSSPSPSGEPAKGRKKTTPDKSSSTTTTTSTSSKIGDKDASTPTKARRKSSVSSSPGSGKKKVAKATRGPK